MREEMMFQRRHDVYAYERDQQVIQISVQFQEKPTEFLVLPDKVGQWYYTEQYGLEPGGRTHQPPTQRRDEDQNVEEEVHGERRGSFPTRHSRG